MDTTKSAIESSKKSKGGRQRFMVLSENDVKILKRDAKVRRSTLLQKKTLNTISYFRNTTYLPCLKYTKSTDFLGFLDMTIETAIRIFMEYFAAHFAQESTSLQSKSNCKYIFILKLKLLMQHPANCESCDFKQVQGSRLILRIYVLY